MREPQVKITNKSDTPSRRRWVVRGLVPLVGAAVLIVVYILVWHPEWMTEETQQVESPVLVFVPAGEFEMGSDDGKPDEQPVHTVYLDSFWIYQTEVTNAQFAEFLNANMNRSNSITVRWADYDADEFRILLTSDGWEVEEGFANYPVVSISYAGARDFCQWAGGRLPTEAEWEYAARGSDGRIYPWGNEFDGTRLNFCDAKCRSNWKNLRFNDGFAKAAPVGSYPEGASPFGVLDMAGNVWEMVADWYDEDYYSISPSNNPQGPNFELAEYWVTRGGAWSSLLGELYSSNRWQTRGGNADVGFRCVIPVP